MEYTHKGQSLISFPSDYTVIDIETTGFVPDYFSIIEISAIKYRENKEVDSFSFLVREDEYVIDEFIENLTGITADMIDGAPAAENVLSQFCDFIEDDILIGHNVNFDINFLYHKCSQYIGKAVTNDFVDTLRIARKLLPELSHHRLDDLCSHYSIEIRDKHRALNDCALTYAIYQKFCDSIPDKDSFIASFKKKSHGTKLHASDIQQTDGVIVDPSNPFYNKVCVFTGALAMLRKDAMQLVVDRGGAVGDNVTAKTNYLVLGNNDYCKTIKDGKSSKHKKAESLILKGQALEIIPESVFIEMLDM